MLGCSLKFFLQTSWWCWNTGLQDIVKASCMEWVGGVCMKKNLFIPPLSPETGKLPLRGNEIYNQNWLCWMKALIYELFIYLKLCFSKWNVSIKVSIHKRLQLMRSVLRHQMKESGNTLGIIFKLFFIICIPISLSFVIVGLIFSSCNGLYHIMLPSCLLDFFSSSSLWESSCSFESCRV